MNISCCQEELGLVKSVPKCCLLMTVISDIFHLQSSLVPHMISRRECLGSDIMRVPLSFNEQSPKVKLSVVDWIKALQRCPCPSIQKLYYVSLSSKRNFADIIKLRTLRWVDYPSLSGWVWCNYKREESTWTVTQAQQMIVLIRRWHPPPPHIPFPCS